MDDTPNPNLTDPLFEAGPLPVLLAIFVVALGAHVALGYLRQIERDRERRPVAAPFYVAMASFSLGSAVWSAAILCISTLDVSFSIGYSKTGLALAWLVSLLGALLPLALLARWKRAPAVGAAGLLLACSVVYTAMRLVDALGLQPQFRWGLDALALSFPAVAAGAIAGIWIGLAHDPRGRTRRRWWRFGAAMMIGFTTVVGLSLVLAAVPLGVEVASEFQKDVPRLVAGLGGGMMVPLVLAALALDLHMRQLRGHRSAGVAPHRQRIRRRGER
ncbi:MAG: hypothetical protein KGL43_07080 [Burkholderiales bacterium]|nr:hypothetical protein [Burkholderiales bacterium]MDE2395090.1 hypothetical protein [Burkholderiales bacterium]MDE2453340.1 hypothetical protein [Burkholderiales bacterium]